MSDPMLLPDSPPSLELNACRWCGAPSVERVEIVPARFTTQKGVRLVAKAALTADVCRAHSAMVQRDRDEAEAAKEAARR